MAIEYSNQYHRIIIPVNAIKHLARFHDKYWPGYSTLTEWCHNNIGHRAIGNQELTVDSPWDSRIFVNEKEYHFYFIHSDSAVQFKLTWT